MCLVCVPVCPYVQASHARMLRYKEAKDAVVAAALPTSYPYTEPPRDAAAAVAAPESLPAPQLVTFLKESFVASAESQVPAYPEPSKKESTTSSGALSTEPLKAGKYVHDSSGYTSWRVVGVGKLLPPLVLTDTYKEVCDKYNECKQASETVAPYTLPAATYISHASIAPKKPASLSAKPSAVSSGVLNFPYLCIQYMLANSRVLCILVWTERL